MTIARERGKLAVLNKNQKLGHAFVDLNYYSEAFDVMRSIIRTL